jgi:hypothetical protein
LRSGLELVVVMGEGWMMKLEIVADLMSAVGDLILEHPAAAAFTAHKLGRILTAQAKREQERDAAERRLLVRKR